MSEIDEALLDDGWGSDSVAVCSALVVTERVRPESVFVEEDVLYDAVDTLEQLFDGMFSHTYFHNHSDEKNHYGYVILWEN